MINGMLTFGYENRFTGPLKAALSIAFGVLLILARVDAMALLVKVIAVAILVFGIFSFAVGMKGRKESSLPLLVSNAVLNIAIAALLFLFAAEISVMVRYLIGSVLVFFGFYQIAVLFSARDLLKGGFWPFLTPIVVVSVGALFFSPRLIVDKMLGIVAGISFIMFGLSEIVTTVKMNAVIKEFEARRAEQEKQKEEEQQAQMIEHEAKDVDYEKVD